MTREQLQKRFYEEDNEAVAEALKALGQHHSGQRFLWWLLELGRFGQQPFGTDPQVTAFRCGELNVGQRVVAAIIGADPVLLTTLMTANAGLEHGRSAQLSEMRPEGVEEGVKDYD